MTNLGLCSRARQHCQKLTAQDKRKCLERAWLLCCQLCNVTRPRIFLDKAKIELTPYLNSAKDRVIDAVPGDAGVNM